MPEETQSTTTQATQTTATQAADDYKPPTREEWAALLAEKAKMADALKERNAESAERRKAAEAAEKAKMEAEGNLKGLLEAERKRLEELAPKATRAEKLEAVIRSEVDALEKAVGEERAKSVAHLSPEDRLPILKQYAALAAAPVKAPASTAGAPAPTALPIDLSKMSDAEKAAFFEGKSPDEVRAALGIKPSRGFFGR